MKPKLIPNAINVFWRAWSVRASFAIAIINGFLIGFMAFQDIVPPEWFLAINVIGPVIVVFLRLLDQGLADED
jgi:hypothetical protein